MIKIDDIIIRQFSCESEVSSYADLRNNLEERALTDHVEIISTQKLLNEFRDHSLWQKHKGTLLITNQNHDILGTISFNKNTDFEVSVGYCLVATCHRSKGIMTKVLKRFTKYLFDIQPGITRISLYTAESNIASRRLAEKCEFQLEGTLKKAYFYRGKIDNWLIYAKIK